MFVNKVFTNLLNENKIKKDSRYISWGVVYAGRFKRNIRVLEIFLEDQFLKEEMLIGSMYYLENWKNIIIQYILHLK